MTEAKTISKKIQTILENPIAKTILDRSSDISIAIPEVKGWWGYDLFNRKPSPAYNEYGIFTGTDLDMACFLYSLAGRGAVINIPEYKARTQSATRKDQVLKSKYNRNGELLEVLANKDLFTFNIRVMDQNVIGEDKVGDFRTFSLTKEDGSWYEGWKTIQFEPTLKENRFITENKLWTGNQIIFNNFVHPNRWTSFFGVHYLITKLMIERLEDEVGFLSSEVKRLLEAGIEFPKTSDAPVKHEYTYGNKVSKKFQAFQVKLHIPAAKLKGDYELFEATQENLVKAYGLKKDLTRTITKLRFMTRATEYAHYMNQDRFPSWMKNVQWEDGFVEPGKRTKWQRLKLFQDKVGEHSISILKRTFEKSVQVAA
jgi:hypothetical protein